jgi:hypothetical protein
MTANVLGLVELAAGDPLKAADAFRTAVAGHPRSLRPGEFAMAKANLALAHERAGDVVRARLSARQALAVREAAEPVASQAAAVAERLGAPAGDVLALLDQEPPARWPALLREEVARWVDADSAERRAEAAAWIAGQAARPGHAALMAEAFLESLLELPPPAMDAVIRALLEALAGCDGEATARFHSETRRSMAGFQPPQERRLRQRFDRIAVELGQEPVWS